MLHKTDRFNLKPTASQKKPTQPLELLKNKKLLRKTKRLPVRQMSKMPRLTVRNRRMMLKLTRVRKLKI